MPTWFAVLMMLMGAGMIVFRRQQVRGIMRGPMYCIGYPVPEKKLRLVTVLIGCIGIRIGFAAVLVNTFG